MLNPTQQRIREFDASGKLVRAGFTWRQPDQSRHTLRQKFFEWPLYPLLLTGPFFVWSLSETQARFDIWSALVFYSVPFGFLIQALMLTKWVRSRLHQYRGVAFNSDGTLEGIPEQDLFAPPGKTEWKRLTRPIDEISSIESQPSVFDGVHASFWPSWFSGEHRYKSHMVTIFFHSGERLTRGFSLHEEDAAIITIQLNQALREIRAASMGR